MHLIIRHITLKLPFTTNRQLVVLDHDLNVISIQAGKLCLDNEVLFSIFVDVNSWNPSAIAALGCLVSIGTQTPVHVIEESFDI